MTFFDEQPDGDLHGECAAEIQRLEVSNNHLQARIDELMLEYCPDEMTPEQIAEWAKHQKPVAEQTIS